MKKISEDLKQEAIRLRLEERLSIDGIKAKTGLSHGTLSVLLRDYQLTEKEVKERWVNYDNKASRAKKVNRLEQYANRKVKWASLMSQLSVQQLAKIAEAAIAQRLLIHGADIYSSHFDGSKYDFLIESNNKIIKIQVRKTSLPTRGNSTIKLIKSDGRKKTKRFTDDDFDFIVGYDPFIDTAYVFTRDDVKQCSKSASVSDKNLEAWDKIFGIENTIKLE